MKQNINATKGITLLEIMLVLAIAATIIAVSFRFYSRYRLEYTFNQIQDNVDTLFQGLRQFYYINCQEGLLSPVPKQPAPPAPPVLPPLLDQPFSVNIQEQLLNKNYLPTGWPADNLLVDASYSGTTEYQGYSAKFIPKEFKSERQATACFNFNDSTGVQCYNSNVPYPQNVILNWQMQVVVKMTNANNARSYSDLKGANCVIKNPPSNTQSVDCAIDNDPEGEYVVFQAAPSMISTDLWPTMPVVKEFNLLYTHDPMYELYNPSIGTGNSDTDKNYRYYLCGG